MPRTTVLTSIFCGLLVLAGNPATLNAALPSLTGSWQLSFVPNTPAIPPLPVAGLATFTSDGSIVETDASQVVPGISASGAPLYATPGHGIWQPGPAVPSLFVQFISIVANANSTLFGKTTTTMTVTLDSTGTKIRGGYTSQLADASGNILRTTSGTVTGQLIPHPKLP